MTDRRTFLVAAATASGAAVMAADPPVRDYKAPAFVPSRKKPPVNATLAEDFVIFAHSDLAMVKVLLAKEPAVIHATVDWGGGDFESALGGAAHMGNREIAEYLLAHGARIDIFCAAMLGQLAAVKTMLDAYPKLIDAKGPHGFSLHWHAKAGGDPAKPVLDYLQSVKKVDFPPPKAKM